DLADAIGRAYGLEGDHRQWAKIPQAELAQQVEAGKAKAMAPRAPVGPAMGDPFAQPDPFAQTRGQLPSSPFNPNSYGPPAEYQQGQQAWGAPPPAGVPQKTPWLLPLLVGVVALVLGGGIAILVVL